MIVGIQCAKSVHAALGPHSLVEGINVNEEGMNVKVLKIVSFLQGALLWLAH
jgi:hypothetical protein